MKVLVTGGCGFIGSHLVDKLIEEGHEVVVIDNLSEGSLLNLPGRDKLTIHCNSILEDLTELYKGVEVVFHLAALTRPQWSILYPEQSNLTNIDGTLNVLVTARDAGVKRVVFASSASIYGDQDVFPTKETLTPNPMSPYALQKSVGEQYLKLFEKLYRLEFNAMRFFNVYGSRMRPEGEYAAVVPKFIDSIQKGISPNIFGDGNQSRDFVHVDDIVRGLIMAGESDVNGEVFNLGSGTNIAVNDIFNLIVKKLGSDVKPNHTPPVVEPKMTLADISKARALLGWVPEVSFDEGISKLL